MTATQTSTDLDGAIMSLNLQIANFSRMSSLGDIRARHIVLDLLEKLEKLERQRQLTAA